MRIKKRLIFNIISFIFIGGLTIFYGYRLIHYYLLENKPSNDENISYHLSELIIDKQFPSASLIEKDNNYIFYGANTNNYLKYSGLLWRIVRIDEENNITAILDSTSVHLSYNDVYEESSINKWLNKTSANNTGIFYNSLTNKEAFLTKTKICLDEIADLKTITCENTNTDYEIGVLSLHDYEEAGGSTSYLNNATNWWTSSVDNKNDKWYITNDGQISLATNLKNYGIRPVITLNEEVMYISGSGTEKEPYIIEDATEDVLNQKTIGEYIKYSNYTWRIIGENSTGVKVALDGYINLDNKEIKEAFSTGAVVFSLKSSSIGSYLNDDFYDTLVNKNYIVEGKWYTGHYSINDDYDYQTIYEDDVTANIGLLSIADMFVNEYIDTYTLTGATSAERTVYTIDDKYELYHDFPTKALKIRPALYLDPNLIVKSGNGSKSAPYEIEG